MRSERRDGDPALRVGNDRCRAGEERSGHRAFRRSPLHELALPGRDHLATPRAGAARGIRPCRGKARRRVPSSSRKRAGSVMRPLASRLCWCSPRNMRRRSTPCLRSPGFRQPETHFPPPGATLTHYSPPVNPSAPLLRPYPRHVSGTRAERLDRARPPAHVRRTRTAAARVRLHAIERSLSLERERCARARRASERRSCSERASTR